LIPVIRRTVILLGIFLPGLVPAANAALWVIDFEGPPSGYVIERGDVEVPLEKLTLLKGGDVITVKEAAGGITLVDQANTRHVLTAGDSPYSVPQSEPTPSLLLNVREWVESWWNTRGNQSTTTTAAVSKGGLDPVFTGAVNGQAMLLSGARRLRVSWRGGIAPFDLRLATARGETLAEVSSLDEFAAALPELSLRPGSYTLQVSGGGAPELLALAVVDEDHLPDTARQILALDVPDEIRFGYLALYLSTEDSWRFEALQLAHRYDLEVLVYTLEHGR
jgi:hypothetical protein